MYVRFHKSLPSDRETGGRFIDSETVPSCSHTRRTLLASQCSSQSYALKNGAAGLQSGHGMVREHAEMKAEMAETSLNALLLDSGVNSESE